ncbi:Multipass membrane protein [Planctomycetales bacterium 10988]|nr:Multipass membrane protein [Planctomycetales bacterium 10988]
MKCPTCSHKHPKSAGFQCSKCGYQFVFDPARDKIADNKFVVIMNKASANGTYHFTKGQFLSALCQKEYESPLFSFGCAIFTLCLIPLSFFISAIMTKDMWELGTPALVIGIPLSLFFVWLGRKHKYDPPPNMDRLNELIRRWKEEKGPIVGLIEEPNLHDPPPEWPEPDMYDYGVERILIVERDILVDWLVLNQMHAEWKTLIVAASGYPTYMVEHANRLLAERPDLPVFLLHDATEEGLLLESRIREEGLFHLAEHPVIDLGITPGEVEKMDRLKALKPEQSDYHLPVDMLPLLMLSTGITAAMLQQTTLENLLMQSQSGADDAGTVGYG